MGTEVNEEKPMRRELTDEDRARIHAEAEAIKARVMAIPLDELAVQVRGRRSAARTARSSGSAGAAPRVDVGRIVELYTADPPMAPKDIAKQVECSYATVVKWLKESGVFDAGKFKSKPPKPVRKTTCSRGHDLTDDSSWTQKYDAEGRPNGTDCNACHREREQERRMQRYV